MRFTVIFLYIIIYTHFGENAHVAIVCSDTLATTLEAYCKNGYNNRIKRCLGQNDEASKALTSDTNNNVEIALKKMESEINESTTEIIEFDDSDNKGDNEPKIFVRKRRQTNYDSGEGIADECCIAACGAADLAKYCK